MQFSPYTPGRIAKNVVGRERQLAYFEERIRYLTELGEGTWRIRVDYASRGLGKTSLLREAERRMKAAGIKTIWVTANPDESLTAGILSQLRSTVENTATRLFKDLGDAVDSATLALGVPGIAKGEVTVRRGEPRVRPPATQSFKNAIVTATEAIKKDGGKGLAILIDEVQNADEESLRVIAYAWQELDSERPLTPVGVFAVGLPNSSEEINKAATSSERFDYRPLPGLEGAAAELALKTLAEDLGVTWTAEALRFGSDLAAGYPHKVQIVGEETWKAAANPDPGFVIGIEHVRAALPGVDEQMLEVFRARWNPAARAQKDFMRAIALLGGTRVSRKDVAAKLGKTTSAISDTRHRLVQKGVIEAEAHGLMSFSVPGFTEWILEHDAE